MAFKFYFRALKQLKERIKEVDKNRYENGFKGDLSFTELFSEKFIQGYTSFKTFNELVEKSAFNIKKNDDIKNISEVELNSFIKKNTKFSSWDKMYSKATMEFIIDQVGYLDETI